MPESKIFIGDFKTIPWRLEEVYADKINNLQIAAPKEIVGQYIEVIKLAGLELVAVDIESISLSRALISKKPEMKDGASIIIIDIGARTTNLSIFSDGGVLQNSITVPIAGDNFTRAIGDKLKIKTEEAEMLKRKFGFDASDSDNKILSILQSSFQPIVKELKEAINYYENNRGEKIEEIILAGGSAFLPKIDEYLAVNLERKVTIGNPLEQISARGGSAFGGKGGHLTDGKYLPILFANVIGLALRGKGGDISKGINLLPREHENTRTKKRARFYFD